MEKTAVVLINWNSARDTLDCITSLLESSISESLLLVVVDNGSGDGSPDHIAAIFPDVTLIRNPQNLGFAAANNIGIQHALNAGATYILVLNNDTVVEDRAIEFLIAALRADPRAGITTPKIYYFEEPQRLWCCGGETNLYTGRSSMRACGKVDDGTFNSLQAVGYAVGAGMMFPREVLERVGGFDTTFFHSAEDVDLSIRVRRIGKHILYVPAAKIWHKVSRSTGGGESPSAIFYLFRSMLLLREKHLSKTTRVLSTPLVLGFLLWSIFRLLIIRHKPRAALAVLKATYAYAKRDLGPATSHAPIKSID